MKRKISVVLVAVGLLFSGFVLTGCTITPESDAITLHYKGGSWDGNKFDKVILPGESESNWTVNDNDYSLPMNIRYWKVCGPGADEPNPTIVSTKPREGEASGIQVSVCTQTNLKLNTNSNDIKDFPGGTIRKFWEELGKRHGANETNGWKAMMQVTVVPALSKSVQDVLRGYDADDLVANKDGIWTEVQNKISANFLVELKRLSGGNYFCGPSFVREAKDFTCPAPEMIIADIDYANKGIQDARDEKRKAIELAAAAKSQADGEVAKKNALNSVYNDPNYLKYLEMQLQLEMAKACAQSQKCVMVVGGGNTTVQVPN